VWQAVVHEINNGALAIYIQRGDDWENGRVFASFTELEQDENPDALDRWLVEARQEATRMNAEEQRAEFDALIRRPEA